MDAELLFRPAGELAELVRLGELSSRELAEAALRADRGARRRAQRVHRSSTPSGALAAADAIGPGDERPFAGVPIAIKDLAARRRAALHAWAPTLFGDFAPDHDAHVVRRLREAGFVIVGKTNMPEFGILPVTEPRRFGPTRNPWDPDRTPGGSSGGAAAAVAAGHGPDRPRQRRRRLDPHPGGLLRPGRAEAQPRPGLARPRPGRATASSSDGVLTRTVADTAAAARRARRLRARRRRPGRRRPPSRSRRAAAREPGALRIGARRLDRRSTRRSTRVCERAARDAAELLAVARPRGRGGRGPLGGPGPARRRSPLVFGTPIALRRRSSARR